MITGDLKGQKKMSKQVALEHIWVLDAAGEPVSLAYATGDLISEADLPDIEERGCKTAEVDASDATALRRAIARANADHLNTIGDVSHETNNPGYRREAPGLEARIEELDARVASAERERDEAETRVRLLEDELVAAHLLAKPVEPPVEPEPEPITEPPAVESKKEEPVKVEDKAKRGPKDGSKSTKDKG